MCVQLSARRAQELAERVEDFVMYCSKVGAGDVKEWTLGAVHINNTSNETRTEITLLEEGIQQGELTSPSGRSSALCLPVAVPPGVALACAVPRCVPLRCLSDLCAAPACNVTLPVGSSAP